MCPESGTRPGRGGRRDRLDKMRPARQHSGATREALRSRPRRRPRPRILASGVMEFWSTGVLRIVGIAPRVRGVGSAFRAAPLGFPYPGLKPRLKPRAEFSCRFRPGLSTLIDSLRPANSSHSATSSKLRSPFLRIPGATGAPRCVETRNESGGHRLADPAERPEQ
jgi:hypothetical protein